MMLIDKNQDQYDQQLDLIDMERLSNEQDINDNESDSALETNEQVCCDKNLISSINIFLDGC